MSYDVVVTKRRRRDDALRILSMIIGPDTSAQEVLDALAADPDARAVIADWTGGACGAHKRSPSWKCPDCQELLKP